MVVPLIIGGVLILAISAAVYKSGSSFGEALKNLTESDEQNKLDYDKDKDEFEKSKRGFLANGFAYLLGENFIEEVDKGERPTPQKPLTGEKPTLTKIGYDVVKGLLDPFNVVSKDTAYGVAGALQGQGVSFNGKKEPA